jgi:proteasome lid subunit RPN8/RPN11
VQRRVEVDTTLPPVRMPAPILHELCQHAVEAFPEECCGLIVGNALERYRRVVRCTNEMTARHSEDPVAFPRDNRAAFYIPESDVLRARKEADEAGESVTAVYHSHVGSGAYLSEMDMEYAGHVFFPFQEADQIVVSVFERVARDISVFRPASGSFTGHAVERVAP